MVVLPAAVAVPFHRLTTPATGRWWRLVLALLLGALGLVVTSLIALAVVVLGAEALGFGTTHIAAHRIGVRLLLATNLGLALLIPVAGLLTLLLYRHRQRWVSSVKPGLRWRWLIVAVGAAGAVWAILLLLGLAGALAERKQSIDGRTAGLLAVVVLTTPLQAAGEEYLFRGFVLQSLGAARLPTWLCCLLSAALFATAHLQFAPPLFADRLLLGVVLAWLAVRTGGLESGIAIHTAKNVSGLIPAVLLGKVSQVVQPSGGVTWVPFAVDVVLLSLASWWLLSLARRRRLGVVRRPTPAALQ